MLKFEDAIADSPALVLGCDPGPTHTAFAAVVLYPKDSSPARLAYASYADNSGLDEAYRMVEHAVKRELLYPAGARCAFLAYECVGAQGKFCGESVFETAAVGGEVRRLFRRLVDGTYKFVSSEWRHALTGQGNARTPLVYHEICKRFPATGGGSDPCKGTKDAPGPLWDLHAAGKGGNVEHLKDALGVALGLASVRFRSGRDPETYRRPL